MKACATGPANGSPHSLFPAEQLEAAPWLVARGDAVLYEVEGRSWEDCVAEYYAAEERRSSRPPPADEMDEMTDAELAEMEGSLHPGATKVAACSECKGGGSEMGTAFILPACAWRVGGGRRPAPVCHMHRRDGDLGWREGCREFLAWYVMTR